MLSIRGRAYAQSGLMIGYMTDTKEIYNKESNPEGKVSFANAENFIMHDELLNYINTHYEFDGIHCTYNEGPIGTKRLREAMASHLNDYFNPFIPVASQHVTFTAGVTGLNEMIAFSLADEGEAILLGRPVYGMFYDDMMTKARCQMIYASFDDVDQFSVGAVKKYEEALQQAAKDGVKVKALLLCNPHNPLGKCYPIDTLKSVFELCNKYNIHLISDEIYALSVFPVDGSQRTPFTSVLSIDSTGLLNKDQIHVLYGMSKDFGAAGLRLGCLVSRNEELTEATRAIGRFNWPSEMSCAIATTILEDRAFVAQYTGKSIQLLSQHYSLATKILDQASIDYVRDGNAGFFLWIDLSPYLPQSFDADGWEAEKLLQASISAAGVEMASGFKYRAEKPGWFRILFSVEKDALEEGLRRIISTIKSQKRVL